MEIRLFHGEAISSCEVKEASKKSPNGKIQFGKVIEIKPTDKQVRTFCPWACSEYTISVDGCCTVCGGITA